MGKKYYMIRMPSEIYHKYKNVKIKMEADIKKFTGRRIPLTMPKVFNAVINPKFNQNFIEVDLGKLSGLAKKNRGIYDF